MLTENQRKHLTFLQNNSDMVHTILRNGNFFSIVENYFTSLGFNQFQVAQEMSKYRNWDINGLQAELANENSTFTIALVISFEQHLAQMAQQSAPIQFDGPSNPGANGFVLRYNSQQLFRVRQNLTSTTARTANPADVTDSPQFQKWN